MGDSLQRLGINQLNHKLKIRRGGFEVTNGNISGSSTSTGSFGKLEVAGNTTLTGDITIGGNMTLGDADTDSINITADLTSNLIPNADSTYNIGSSTKNWQYGYIEEMASTNITASGTITGSAVYGTTIGQNRTDGLKTITIEANSTVNQDLTTDASVTFLSVDTGQGYRALTNLEEHGGQEVPHLHFHLFGGEKVGKMVSE